MLSEGPVVVPVVVSAVDVFVCVLDWVDWLIDEVIEEDEQIGHIYNLLETGNTQRVFNRNGSFHMGYTWDTHGELSHGTAV